MANAIDLHVGKRLRRRRRLLGLTQQQLAESIGIRFQQIQKYETGANRMTASRLYELAAALNVPVKYFYEGLVDATGQPSILEIPDVVARVENDVLALVRAYYALPEAERRQLRQMGEKLQQTKSSNAA